MTPQYNKSTIISSLFWKLLERGGTQGIQFFVSIILARLLSPEEYGIIAIVMVFIFLANVFIESGFNTALIQKKEADEVDFSSVFYLSLGIASMLYVIIFFAAPLIANFYNQPILTLLLRVLSVNLFFGAFISIQNAYVARHMMFKSLFLSSIIAVIISGVAGVVAAIIGLGIWALVVQQIISQVSMGIILWNTVKWRPHLVFSASRVKNLFSFGSKLLISSLLDNLYTNLTVLIIGGIYSPSILGYYNKGQLFPQLIVSNINGSIQSVLLPALSVHQEDRNRVKEMTRRAIVSSSFLIFPMMVGIAVVAEPLVILLLTEKWLPIIPFLQISCITFSLWPIHTANLQAINAMGRSDIFLKLEIVKKSIGIIIIAISIPFGIYVIAIGGAVSGIIGTFINAYPNKKLLNYSYQEQWLDILPSLLISLAMGGIVFLYNFLNMPEWQILGLQILTGSIVYILLAILFKVESFTYLIVTMREHGREREDVHVKL